MLVGFLGTRQRLLAARGITAFAMEAIPRISRAQGMDALSSQADDRGLQGGAGRRRARDSAAADDDHRGRHAPAARVLVLGAGVAGLQALATARRLGARCTGYDVRPEAAEQVRSVGADWLDLGIEAAGEGGYARALTDDERAAQQHALGAAIKTFDIVITTALVPGRPAPRLVSADAVAGMRPGSVIVDLAGETGGNCELTRPGEVIAADGVTIAAPLNLPATVPEHASQLYARNVEALLELMLHEGRLSLGPHGRGPVRGLREPCPHDLGGGDLMLLTNLATLVLAGFVGYAVISKVPNTLHTPLMSGTNAIHGIVVLGGIVLLATGAADDALTKALLTVAVMFGMINVVGGFLVTDRMLEMFKPRKARDDRAA